MRIGELASATGTDAETLRYYERIGLLERPPRQANGYRDYPKRAEQQVRFIRHCRKLDLSLAEIERILTLSTRPTASCDDINHILDRHVIQVRSQMAALHTLERQLLALQGQCEDGHTSRDCGILKELIAAAQEADCICHSRI